MSLSPIRKLVGFDIFDGLQWPAERNARGRKADGTDRDQPMACIADNDISIYIGEKRRENFNE
jgi:hypothetical protein